MSSSSHTRPFERPSGTSLLYDWSGTRDMVQNDGGAPLHGPPVPNDVVDLNHGRKSEKALNDVHAFRPFSPTRTSPL